MASSSSRRFRPAPTRSRVELAGFTAWEASDIVLLLGQRRTVNGITLKVGGVKEVISVTSRPEITPVDSGEKSARLTSEQIQNVPMVGRAPASCSSSCRA